MTLTIRTKLIALLLGLTLMVLVVVLGAINKVFSETITDEVVLDFAQLQNFFQLQQNLQYDRLIESSYLISENSTFKANIALNDPPSADRALEEFSYFIKSDFFMVTNNEGIVLSWFNKAEATGLDLSARPSISDALQGIDPEEKIDWPQLWAVDGDLYQTVTIPIFIGSSAFARIIGTITLGTRFQNSEAQSLKQNTPLEVIMFLEDTPIALSDTVMSKDIYSKTASLYTDTIAAVVNELKVTEPFRTNLDGEEVLAFFSPLGKGENAYYLAYVPVAQQFRILAKLEQNIFFIAIIAIFILIPIAILLARYFAGPIRALTEAMLQVRNGNLDISVKPKTKDEIGILTRTFNEMIIGLRERFALSKYVGDHTLRMIQKTSNEKPDLGGSREKLAILFTDIRGSTSKIEETNPEYFIKMLNQTLSSQADAVLSNSGSIDKFVGDSLIALFSGDGALERAILSGIEIQKAFVKDKKASSFFGGVGVGINYGEMILGNMGAKERMDYTVIGAEVNLCARLCSVAKSEQVLLPKNIIKELPYDHKFNFKTIEKQSLKGFSQEKEIVEVVYD